MLRSSLDNCRVIGGGVTYQYTSCAISRQVQVTDGRSAVVEILVCNNNNNNNNILVCRLNE